jgi:hypothetical protein
LTMFSALRDGPWKKSRLRRHRRPSRRVHWPRPGSRSRLRPRPCSRRKNSAASTPHRHHRNRRSLPRLRRQNRRSLRRRLPRIARHPLQPRLQFRRNRRCMHPRRRRCSVPNSRLKSRSSPQSSRPPRSTGKSQSKRRSRLCLPRRHRLRNHRSPRPQLRRPLQSLLLRRPSRRPTRRMGSRIRKLRRAIKKRRPTKAPINRSSSSSSSRDRSAGCGFVWN